jgi:hypothetical protein
MNSYDEFLLKKVDHDSISFFNLGASAGDRSSSRSPARKITLIDLIRKAVKLNQENVNITRVKESIEPPDGVSMWERLELLRADMHKTLCRIARHLVTELRMHWIRLDVYRERSNHIRSLISERVAGMKRLASVPLGAIPTVRSHFLE